MRIIVRDRPYWRLNPWVTVIAGVMAVGAVWYGIIWALMAVWP